MKFRSRSNCLRLAISFALLVPATFGHAASPPFAADQTASTFNNTAKSITLSATDVDGGALVFAVVAAPTQELSAARLRP